MEKIQKKLVDGMIRTSYRGVIERGMALYLVKNLSEMAEHVTIESEFTLSEEQKKEVLKVFWREMVKKDKIKKEFQVALDHFYKLKSDFLAEVMRQHDLDKNPSENTMIHDMLGQLFDQCLWNLRVSVGKGDWDNITKVL